MAALALKAIGYGAEKIPDRLFEKIPGGFFRPRENKKSRKGRAQDRHRSEERHSSRGRRRSHRDRTLPTDYSDHSAYDDTDHEKKYRKKKQHRRARSLGSSYSRSPSRGRRREPTGDLDGEMGRAERGPEFSPPPPSEYRPYDPRDYAPPGAATGSSPTNTYRDSYGLRGSSSARTEYGYPPQPPPLAQTPVSSSAERYTPAGAYAPSPTATAYAPYNPADYASPSSSHRTSTGYHPFPPPFYRHQSRSQPSLPQHSYPDNQHQTAYLGSPSRQGSTSSSHHHRHDDGKKHRTRSAGHHGRSRSRVTDQLRDRFDNLDVKDKSLAASVGGALAGGLAGNSVGHGTLSTLVGAAIGGLGGRELEKRHEKKKAVAASQSREKSRSRHSSGRREYSRSPSRDRRRGDDSESDSDSDSDEHRRTARKKRGSNKRRDHD